MIRKKNTHTKRKHNTNFQVIIMQTTKKPISFSISKLFSKILVFSFVLFVLFSLFFFIDNKNLRTTISNKNNEIVALKHENSLKTKENTKLKTSLVEKNKIIEEKAVEIEEKLCDLERFKQTIRDMVGLGQGGSDVSSRDMTSRMKLDSTNNTIINSNSYLDISSIESINIKLQEYENILLKDNEEMDNLYKDVEERLDYLERIPNFFPTTGRISSYFGSRKNPFTYTREFHHGLDIANYSGTEIMSAGKGTVIKASYDYLFGRYIVIDHGYDFTTKYAHLWKINVNEGDIIEKGQVIGLMGNTGESTGPHLHFEIRVNEEAIDPLTINEEQYY